MFSNFVLLGLVFFSSEPRDWLGRTSPKLSILCRVGRKTNSVQFSGFGSFITLCYFISSCHDDHTPVISQHVVATALVGASAKYVNFLVFAWKSSIIFLKSQEEQKRQLPQNFSQRYVMW